MIFARWLSPPGGDDSGDPKCEARREARPPLKRVEPNGKADAERVARIRAGDIAEFETLYLEYVEPLWGFAQSLLGASEPARDVVQDVFAALWYTRDRWEPESTVRAYLFRAVRNRAISLRRHDDVVERAASAWNPTETAPGMGRAGESADAAVLRDETEALVHRRLATLTERQRTVLLLWWQDALSLTEIAGVLGVSVPAAHKLLGKAQAHLLTAGGVGPS